MQYGKYCKSISALPPLPATGKWCLIMPFRQAVFQSTPVAFIISELPKAKNQAVNLSSFCLGYQKGTLGAFWQLPLSLLLWDEK